MLNIVDNKGMTTPSVLSKKRFYQLQQAFEDITDEELVQKLMEKVKEIMNFDPSKSTYSPERGQKILSRRHKLRDEHGISTYVSSGAKACYEKKKQNMIMA